MSTLHLVDPELRDILALFPARNFTVEELPAVRAAAAEMPLPQLPPGLTVSEVHVPREGSSDVRVLVTRPTALPADAPAMVWVHGGGYVLGSADSDQVNAAQLALGVGMVVASVDYGLAPENPHPGPVEDCYAALRWLHENSGDLGVDRTKIAIGGASAGGGLAAALGLLARDRGEVPVAFQHLVFPMIDDRTVTREPNPTTGEFVWTRASNTFGWRSLLGSEPGGEGVSPYAAAARAEDLTGLPPTFLEVGSLDLFLDEDVEFALRLVRAGVPTELHVYPGAFHGYQMVATSTVAKVSGELGITALRRALG